MTKQKQGKSANDMLPYMLPIFTVTFVMISFFFDVLKHYFPPSVVSLENEG